jgi:hypothetical protein
MHSHWHSECTFSLDLASILSLFSPFQTDQPLVCSLEAACWSSSSADTKDEQQHTEGPLPKCCHVNIPWAPSLGMELRFRQIKHPRERISGIEMKSPDRLPNWTPEIECISAGRIKSRKIGCLFVHQRDLFTATSKGEIGVWLVP